MKSENIFFVLMLFYMKFIANWIFLMSGCSEWLHFAREINVAVHVYTNSGIYQMICHTCQCSYIEETDRN
jgi:hypothetical protein